MGSCLSKKSASAASSPVSVPNPPPEKFKSDAQLEKKKAEEESVVKKEIFIIKHRKSHEIERQRSDEEKGEAKEAEEVVEKGKNVSGGNGLNGGLGNGNGIIGGSGAPVRTSSCTKEEVDAILIQCGRLSRSSSTGKAALSSENGGRKYSGSKRSYDFDNENGNVADGDDDAVAKERENRRRERRQSQGRRRTPSREREREHSGQQRSGSRERANSGGGGRRVSRSPGRRSESPITTSTGANSNSFAAANANSRPGKMVSVPPTVSSLAMDKSTNGSGSGEPNSVPVAVKRIQVKRNVGGDGAVGVGARTAASPRARSPARLRASNENSSQNPQQPVSLSRSNSRKAEHSPYRRNPLSEIDNNIISQVPVQKPNAEHKVVQGAENRTNNSNQTNLNCKNPEQRHPMAEETKGGPHGIAGHVALNVISSDPESLKPHAAVTRSRSSRLSRDLDINPETLSNPNASAYTALLLEDIQNFHQKNTTNPAAFSLPPCVTKACSILEAVADLNSSTGSNLSTTFSEDRQRNPIITEQINKTNNDTKPSPVANPVVKLIKSEMRDPILESEVVANDDLMEPSFHKYVTVRRGTTGGDDLEEQESSGSNSFGGSHQQWVSSSSWEPNSAESTDHWTSSSRSVSRQNDFSSVGIQRQAAVSESGRVVDESGKRPSVKKRDAAADHHHHHQQNGNGIGRGRIGSRGPHIAPAAVAAST